VGGASPLATIPFGARNGDFNLFNIIALSIESTNLRLDWLFGKLPTSTQCSDSVSVVQEEFVMRRAPAI
jgi:hypothetical protein